jgi:hypothetical protein
MTLAVETAAGVYTVDPDEDEIVDFVPGAELPEEPGPAVELPLLVTAAAEGSTVVAVVNRRPPLVVSYDAGSTWREAGGGLPAGKAVTIADGEPDRIAFATTDRVYVSTDGGRFWRRLEAEFDEIVRVGWLWEG